MGIRNPKEGLDPEILAYWYKRIEERAIESAPSHLKDKIRITQNRILWMKFEWTYPKELFPVLCKS
ncbi:MAG: hypothetical protein WAM42_22835 [Candidatus Nitrosopolaris sp.]